MRIIPVNNYYQNNNHYPNNVHFGVSIKPKVPAPANYNELKVFVHHIYEYKKGLRSLILTTEKKSNENYIKYRLEKDEIPYVIHDIDKDKINVYFGSEDCINVVKTFSKKLSKLSPEQDFMLGIMLGYDKILQCQRYMKRLVKT